ncbi:TPA: phage tail protein [Escherichia coli]
MVIKKVGLGEGSALPVGVPVPWPSATPPTGWLKCNGAAFSAKEYPELAKAYPKNKLPDLRGEFIRGWDDERGVDSGRTLLSAQGDAIRNITGGFGQLRVNSEINAIVDVQSVSGAFYGDTSVRNNINVSMTYATDRRIRQDVYFSAANVVPTANENRPRNIAFNYIVRAA